MARSFNEIVIDLITYVLGKNPKIDISPGQVFRDVLVDGPAAEFENLYAVSDQVKTSQSLLNAEFMSTQDMDNLASNYGIVRKPASPATGNVIFYSQTQPTSDFTFNAGTRLATDASTGSNQITFTTTNVVRFLSALEANYYNPDTGFWEIEAAAISENGGTDGNVGAFAISKILNTDTPFRISNRVAFNGGTDQESNTELASRTLDAFTGNNKGTKNGYEGTVKSQDGVLDALVVGPGDPLMVRDGGQGGKVDIWTYTSSASPVELTSSTESSLGFTWDNTEQSLIDYTFVFPRQPMVAEAQTIVFGTTFPSSPLTNIALYESRNPAPSGVPYIAAGDYHYTLVKTNDLNQSNSALADDRIIWDSNTLEQLRTYPSGINVNNSLDLSIIYSYNNTINTLQNIIDQPDNKIVTADVLVKDAVKTIIDVQTSVNLLREYKSTSSTETQTINNIITAITDYLNSELLGQKIEKSDIVQVAHGVPGVDNVILNSIIITRRYDSIYDIDPLQVENIQAGANEYFYTGNIQITSV